MTPIRSSFLSKTSDLVTDQTSNGVYPVKTQKADHLVDRLEACKNCRSIIAGSKESEF